MDDDQKNKINCFAVVRGSDHKVVITSLCDLYRHAHLTFVYTPRAFDSDFADEILVHILKLPLKSKCKSAAVVPLVDDPGSAIQRLREIHPPAHVMILSRRYDMFDKVMESFLDFPEVDFNLSKIDPVTREGIIKCQ